MHVHRGDVVEVVTGDDRDRTGRAPKTGKVLRVIPEKGKIVVEGVNRVYKHMRPSQRNPQGGRLSKEMPIDASNALLFCPQCRRGVRVGRRYTADGSKERFCKKCSFSFGTVSAAKAKYAQT